MGREVNPEEIIDILLQGDTRYSLSYARDLWGLFEHKALEIEEESLPDFTIREEEFEKISGPQQLQKVVAIQLLIKRSFNVKGCEISLEWGIVDVLGETHDNKLIAVECGPCRLNKVINYFRIKDLQELWVLHYYSNDKKLFIIKRGKCWSEELKEFDNKLQEQLRKIKSPLDNL